MPGLYRRVLSDADPLATECVYLTDAEIKSNLALDQLDAVDATKEQLFELCKEFREIFASAANSGKLDTAQHSIDTDNAAPIKLRPYRLSPEKRTVVRDAIAKILEEGVIEPLSSPL